jgi:hypothetical protein
MRIRKANAHASLRMTGVPGCGEGGGRKAGSSAAPSLALRLGRNDRDLSAVRAAEAAFWWALMWHE